MLLFLKYAIQFHTNLIKLNFLNKNFNWYIFFLIELQLILNQGSKSLGKKKDYMSKQKIA